MDSHKEEENTSIIFSVGRNGTNIYNNLQCDMPCDYDLKDKKCFDDCQAMIDSVIDDDKACIEKLLNNKAARKKQNNGYIMPQKPTGTGNYFEFNQHLRFKELCARIKHLCWNNFYEDNAMHVYLTFDSKRFPEKDFTDLKTAKAEFSKFIKRMNNHYDNFRHVTVYARQENGNWHFHLLCNLYADTEQEFIREIWGFGIVGVIHKKDKKAFNNMVNYLCENLQKNFSELAGEKAVLHSECLQDNLKLMSWKKEDYFIMDCFIQSAEREEHKPYGKDGNYYVPTSIDGYWNHIVMATLKKTKFKHKKYRPEKRKKEGGDANATEKSSEDG